MKRNSYLLFLLPVIIFLLFSCSADGNSETSTNGIQVLSSDHKGVASVDGFIDGSGQCGFDANFADLMIARVSNDDWDDCGWCGAFAQVEGPDGTAIVKIVDRSVSIASGDLEITMEVKDAISPGTVAPFDITWRFVAGNLSGPVKYKYGDDSTQWYTEVIILNHNLPIASMDYSKDQSTWAPVDRSDSNWFTENSGFGDGITHVRITAIDGQVLIDELPVVIADLVVEGDRQFD